MDTLDWKKLEKTLYLPGPVPERIEVPRMGFLSVDGRGEPGSPEFTAKVEALFGLSYAIKMAVKKGASPVEARDYAVYPLEGTWDLDADSAPVKGAPIDKKSLVYTLQIRQPGFVKAEYVHEIMESTRARKPEIALDGVRFEEFEEGPCLQILHRGPFDEEPRSFALLESHLEAAGLVRRFRAHREIYLGDFRRTAPEKLRTVLRIGVRIPPCGPSCSA